MELLKRKGGVKISCFIPSYNEEKIIEKCIRTVTNFFKTLNYDFELFVIDDASVDNTENIVIDITSRDKRIKYLKYTIGPSKRENLARSFEKAKGDVVLFMDADLSADINCLPQLINKIQDNADIVIGSRYVKGADARREFLRLFYSKLYNWFVKIGFRSNILDHQCGMKVFKKTVLLKLVDKMGYDSTFKRGWTWDTELLLRARKQGFKIVEIPVKWRYRKGHHLNPFKQVKSIIYLSKLKRKL